MVICNEQSAAAGVAVIERRFLVRYPVKGSALVLRDSDVMRVGCEANLVNVSIGGLGLDSPIPLNLNEQVKILVTNAVQRITKEVRGVVRHVTPAGDGRYRVGVELYGRLTPLEVSLLRMGLAKERPLQTWM